MVGLDGLEPPTSHLSVLRPLVAEYHSSRYWMRSGSTIQLMLSRELQQCVDQALQESNERWLVLGLRAKDHDFRMGFSDLLRTTRHSQDFQKGD
jgi:hypothetical protein